ncbi:4-hydroxyphenylacetate 3-monooxygenase, oxygenase component [Pontibacillus salicampi]|uniref:4-hydroxyphenylacetate 3-monooxygenase, oxygenase component n=1 Tax=Pontibacillus salicampi TaxID=1449801 RepID=A0ABV6LHZ9_9BACI
MPVISGDEYKKRIDRMHAEIWLDGSPIQGRISEHPAFRGAIKSQGELYDLQLKHKDVMTYTSDKTGNAVGASFLIPRTKEDLEKRRQMVQVWARHTGGLMGRSPDYMNTAITAYAASSTVIKGEMNSYPERLTAFYEMARERDLSFTHAFVSPQYNRSSLAILEDDCTNARIIDTTEEGIIMHGAKLLATQGGMTDELFVLSAPGKISHEEAYAFSIPSNTKGLKFIARQSLVGDDSAFNSPLSSRFEEMDSVVVFDHVLVPWERVFIHENIKAVDDLYNKGKFVPLTLHQICSRQAVKTELLLGIAQSMVESIEIGEYQHVQSKVSEIITGLETQKALLLSAEATGKVDEDGVFLPNRQLLYVAIHQFQNLYPRYTEIVQLLGASGMITIPTVKDFNSSIAPELDTYLQSKKHTGREKVALYRLAWDLTMSSFGTRQTLYERFFFGDPIRVSQIMYQQYDKSDATAFVQSFLEK